MLINVAGIQVEANMILVWLFTITDTFYVVVLVKSIILIIIGYGINHINREFLSDKKIITALIVVNIWYVAVVMGSFYLIYIIGL